MVGTAYGSFADGKYDPPPPLNASVAVEGAPGTLRPSEHSLLRSGGNWVSPKSGVNILELVFVPWCIVVVVLLCLFNAGAHGYFLTVAVIPVVTLPLVVWFLYHQYKRQRHPEVILGILCLIAALISLSIGLYAVFRSLVEYHRLSQGASYVNELPSQAASSRIDATTLSFTNRTSMNLSHVFGFTDTRDPKATMYCVVPVWDGDPAQKRVQFWAAGTDCCEARGNFTCFPKVAVGAHGALVLPKDQQKLDGFKQAIEGALGAYKLMAGDNYLLVQWHEDPVGYRNGLWHGTATLFSIVSGVYFIISLMIGLAVLPVLTPKVESDMAADPELSASPEYELYSQEPGAQAAPMPKASPLVPASLRAAQRRAGPAHDAYAAEVR